MAKKCQNADNWFESNSDSTKTTYLWTIDNFSQLNEPNGERMDSPTFSALNEGKTKWVLVCYPNGCKEGSKDYVSVFLRLQGGDDTQVALSFELALINSKQEIYVSHGATRTFNRSQHFVWGWPHFICWSVLETQKEELLPNDRLTIYCEITSDKRKLIGGQMLEIKPKKSLIDDMRALFADMSYSDIEIVVRSKTFKAHKIILKTRSSYFAAMFRHPMKESDNNQVILEGIEEKVFAKILHFIYTDKCEREDIYLNVKVFTAADMYNLNELKSICEEYIIPQLTPDTVCDVLIMANNLSAEKLKSTAIEFIKNNVFKVVVTEEWKAVMDIPELLKYFN